MMLRKKIYLYDRLFVFEILLLNILKLLKIPGFLFKTPGFFMFKKKLKFKVFQVFPVKWQL